MSFLREDRSQGLLLDRQNVGDAPDIELTDEYEDTYSMP